MIDNDFNTRYRAALTEWSQAKLGTVEVIDESTADLVHILIRPTNPLACQISIASRNKSTQFKIGQHIFFDEVDALYATDGSRWSSVMNYEQFVSLLDAVAAGNVFEQVGYRQDSVVRTKGCVEIDKKKFCMSVERKWRLFSSVDRTVDITYEAA